MVAGELGLLGHIHVLFLVEEDFKTAQENVTIPHQIMEETIALETTARSKTAILILVQV